MLGDVNLPECVIAFGFHQGSIQYLKSHLLNALYA